ncbi:MAG: family 10 glycosylhydrolase [Cyanobacteria bacterium Co-bin13]|nr:family 10 glycosylhydrolase [Cyanobacteria bacterium Co-bin13]
MSYGLRRLRWLVLALLVALLSLVGPGGMGVVGGQPGLASSGPSHEIRGVWLTNIDSNVLFQSQVLQETMQTLADHHFNTVYPTVWNWGFTLFPSAIASQVIGYRQGLYPDVDEQGRNEALEATQGDRDMLKELLEMAHGQGLSVIPWFEFGLMAPANSRLALRHPDWLTQKQGALPQAQLYLEGHHSRVWLNPFHPQVQAFLLALIGELMANYDVDGLQLDDHFALPVEFGYDPFTVNLYRQEHGGKAPPTNPYDAEWTRWRANKMTQLMDKVFRVVKARRPRAILSLSPHPADTAYQDGLQDWPTWWRDGYVEELVIQAYRDSLQSFVALLQDPELRAARDHVPTGVGILTGLRHQPVPIALIQQQVQAARSMGYAGVSFFFYETIWRGRGDLNETRSATVRSLFTPPRPRPRA